MKLIHLEYFCAVCRMGSTTQAAAAISISQPAVSAAIRELENEFGVLLFTRVGKRLEITEAGKKLFELSQDILAKADNAAQIMKDMGGNRNRLSLGITPMLACLFLPHLFDEFCGQYPNVDFSVTEGGKAELFQKLQNKDVDAVISSRSDSYDDMYGKIQLCELSYGVCLNKKHPLSVRERVSVRDLKEEPLAGFSLGYNLNQAVDRWFMAEGLTPNIVFRTSQISTMWEMVSHGLCSSIMYTALGEQRPDLVFVPLDSKEEHVLKMPINLYWRKDDFLYTHTRNLISCIKAMRLGSADTK